MGNEHEVFYGQFHNEALCCVIMNDVINKISLLIMDYFGDFYVKGM